MRIGLDFDNTIVCYDELFHAAALAKNLIPPDTPPGKTQVRDVLRQADREGDWTRLQGEVYGERIAAALPFPGVHEFLLETGRRGIETHIVSHRTRRAYAGTDVDMHQAARDWISKRLTGESGCRLPLGSVNFEETLAEKMSRIAKIDCHVFVDDLPEFLKHPDFPSGVLRILFDPAGLHKSAQLRRAGSWAEVATICFQIHESSP